MMRALIAAVVCICVPCATRAAESPVFDIPRLDGVTVDGVGSDWGDDGFHIRLLTTVDGAVRPIADLDAHAQLAWDDDGLLVLVDITDDTPDESENDASLWEGDGIEVFAAAKQGSTPYYQVAVSPGIDTTHPELRRTLHAKTGVDAETLAVETAAAATEGGYAIEARLPWANLGIDPEEGLETAFQLYVNDRDGEGPTFGLAWYPRREAHTDPSAMHRVRLADSASSSVVAAAAGKYDKLRRIVVQARGVADSAGARVEVRDGDIVVADESLTLTDGRAAATLTLPMPAIGAPRPNLSVNIAGAHTADLDLPDADGLRARELTEAELHFHPSVFASDDFPGCDFEESRRVESLIGPYTIETQFYDAQYAIAEKATEPGRYGAIVTIRAEGGATYTRYRTLFRSPDTPSWIEEFVRHVPASIGLPPEYGIPEDAHRVHASAIGRHIKYALRDSFYDNDGIAPLLAGLYETTEPSRPSDASNDLVAMDRQWWVGLKRRLYNTAEAFPDPVARPERVDGPAAPVIREGSAEAAGMTADAAANIDAVCREWAGDSDEGFAVLVARHGVIVLHDAYGERDGRPMSVNHPSWMASITKLLGGTLMMMLVDQGLVDLDATMDTYLPAFRDIDVQTPMTVRHLYTHTNGLWGHWGDELHDFEEVISEYYPYLEIGVRHGYNGAGCALAGKIIESVSGEGLPQFYAKHLLDPLGISVTAATDMSWQTRSMPMDMARIGQMLLNKGQYGDLRFFRPETFEKMLPVSLVPLLGPETEIEWGIGATWFKDPGLGEGTFAHGAASAATLRIDPENDMVIVMTRNAGGENFGEYHPKFLAAIVDGIVDSAD